MPTRFTNLTKAFRRTLRDALGPPRPRELWLASLENHASVHSSIEFSDQQPDAARVQIGKDCCLERDVTIWLSSAAGAHPRVILGQHVFVGRNCYIGAYQPITIGDNVLIGAYSYIISANHNSTRRNIPIWQQGFSGSPVEICDDAWIGAHVTVLPGISIGAGAIVGANSVVTKSIPPFQIWAGAPARHLKDRPENPPEPGV